MRLQNKSLVGERENYLWATDNLQLVWPVGKGGGEKRAVGGVTWHFVHDVSDSK